MNRIYFSTVWNFHTKTEIQHSPVHHHATMYVTYMVYTRTYRYTVFVHFRWNINNTTVIKYQLFCSFRKYFEHSG